MNSAPANREKKVQFLALGWLLLLGTLALAGPYGMLSLSEQSSLLEIREGQIGTLLEEKSVLANRVTLLDPDNVDPDLASELVRYNLNVAHRDEYVVDLSIQP